MFDPKTDCHKNCYLSHVAEQDWEEYASTTPQFLQEKMFETYVQSPTDYKISNVIKQMEFFENEFGSSIEECEEYQNLPPHKD